MEVLIALIVIALIAAVVVAVLLPRMKAAKREREVHRVRGEVAEQHRSVADDRARRAEAAEAEARRARAEAEMHDQEAHLAELGERDDRLFGGDGADERTVTRERRDERP